MALALRHQGTEFGAARTEGLFESRPMTVSLLEVEPDLAADIEAKQLAAATMASRAEIEHLAKGAWSPARPQPGDLGFWVVSGLLARQTRIGRRQALELVTPGDLIRPGGDDEHSLLHCESHWLVLRRAAVAVLDERFSRVIRPWPQLHGAVCARAGRRGTWMAVQAAIDAHPTVEERLVLLFCHLAERTGRVCPQGILVDVPLSHRLIAHAVSALRPSVTTGLMRLRSDERLVERGRHEWLITHAGLDFAAELCRQAAIEC